MPHRNTIRSYAANFYYHIYNRGVEKRKIFMNHSDYYIFLSIIEDYLTPKDVTLAPKVKGDATWRSKLDKNEIEIISFCLMPNHFHFLIKQNTKNGITRFMRRVSNSYVSYFNKKYQRQGGLFQGKFKAALVNTDAYFLHLTRYIHLNALEVGPLYSLKYPYSSYECFVSDTNSFPWVNTYPILNLFDPSKHNFIFKKFTTYQSFVEEYNKDSKDILGELALD